jgi:hypothetical protein
MKACWINWTGLEKRVVLHDALGYPFALDLRGKMVAIQRKGRIMTKELQSFLQIGERLRAQAILSDYLALIRRRSMFGIANKDGSFMNNFALTEEGRVFQLDIGSFYRTEENPSYSFFQTVTPVSRWLMLLDQPLGVWYDQQVACICQELIEAELQALERTQ